MPSSESPDLPCRMAHIPAVGRIGAQRDAGASGKRPNAALRVASIL